MVCFALSVPSVCGLFPVAAQWGRICPAKQFAANFNTKGLSANQTLLSAQTPLTSRAPFSALNTETPFFIAIATTVLFMIEYMMYKCVSI